MLAPPPSYLSGQSGSCSPFAVESPASRTEAHSLHRSSSYETKKNKPARKPLVRFASSQELQGGEASNMLGPGKVQRLCTLQDNSKFINPFALELEDTSRTNSSSSDAASYLRPDAFAGHRDTLARIPPRLEQETTTDDDETSQSSVDEATLINLHAFAGHRDTFARIHFEKRVAPFVPNHIIEKLLSCLSTQDYLNMRLTCRQWYRALPQPNVSAIHRLPREMLQLIFSFQEPCDFDAARHTCRAWFLASLDLSLLCNRRRARSLLNSRPVAQNTHIYNDDGEYSTSVSQQRSDQHISDEWLMSKRLATALKLSPDWRGSWLSSPSDDDNARFHLAERLNFRRMLLGTSHKEIHTKTFTISGCGRYLLVLTGHDVFIYRLGGCRGTMIPIVRLAANRNVLKVSMDTSSGRYAVAALLDNRTGLLWDIADEAEEPTDILPSTKALSLGISTGARTMGSVEDAHALAQPLPQRRRGIAATEHGNSQAASESQPTPTSMRPSRSNSVPESPDHDRLLGDDVPFTESPQSEIDSTNVDDRLAIQTRPTAVYRNLGTAEDPPRSVAICPQRKCIAFGCRLGIELHWVDALTGGDLSRWFPLAAPSDHLYFLPERVGIDSTRKLRLISSAQGPSTPVLTRSGSMPARLLVRRSTHDRGRRQSMTRLFFGNLPFPAAATAILPASWTNSNTDEDDHQGVLRTVDCDHYQAIPLSDGSHVLYTDPATGQLCLGSDAPVGAPTKLVRKVIFIPPDVVGDDGWGSLMSCYTAGHELSWGVRVVAAQRDGRIVLYNVPSDLFSYLRNLRSSVDIWDETSGVLAQSDLLMDDILTAHPNTIADAEMGNDAARSHAESPFRTIRVEGVQVGHVGHEIVDDIVVRTAHGGIGIWVFCRSGLARRLDIYMPLDHPVRSRFVSTDGLLYDEPQPVVVDGGESTTHDAKGKQRSDSYAAGAWSSDHSQIPGCDGAYDIDVDVAGGLWIAETDGEAPHDAFPDCPECDEELAAEMAVLRLQIEITGSAIKEGPLYALILADECD